jgi:hypothetical protein
VVADQLRISEGWVKCGQCSEIFDASKHLMEAECIPIPKDQMGELAPAHTELTNNNDTEPPLQLGNDREGLTPNQPKEALPEDDPASQIITIEPLRSENEQDAVDISTQLKDVQEPEMTVHSVDGDSSQAADMTESTPVHSDNISLTEVVPSTIAEDAAVASIAPSFLNHGTATGKRQRPAVRAALIMTCALLSMILVVQWLYFERQRLAAQHPDVQVALQRFCDFTDCRIVPWQHIESLSVDSADFQHMGKNSYRLNFVMKNLSAVTLALPSIELTLTDSQDKPTYRRVFNSDDFGVSGKEIAGGSEKAASIGLRVNSDTHEATIRGYRLLIFYP